MKLLVVEPHPDDAFLSVGWHIESLWAQHDVTILTVYSNPIRAAEAEHYGRLVGADTRILGLRESRMDNTGPIETPEEVLLFLSENFFDQVVFPLGLQHPDHYRVALAAPKGALRYLDTPYQAKQKLAEELSTACWGRKVHSIVYPPKQKWKHIKVYKSQSLFFHYNPVDQWKIPEIIVEELQ